MKLERKLAYMALGGLCTLAGMLLTLFVTPLNAVDSEEDVVFRRVACKQLYITNDDGELVSVFGNTPSLIELNPGFKKIVDNSSKAVLAIMNDSESLGTVITNSKIQLLNEDDSTQSSAIISADVEAGTLALSDGHSGVAGISYTDGNYNVVITSKDFAAAALRVDTKASMGSLMLSGKNGNPIFARGQYPFGD